MSMLNTQINTKTPISGLICLSIIFGGICGCHPSAGKSTVGGLPPVPVVAGRVAQKDVPIYLDGLGTVQAFNAVTVHVRVDGELKKVAFTEGQDVKAGDVLAQIDPDPFRAALAQVEAQLANARLDLQRDVEQIAAKIIAQQVFDTQQALVNQLAAAVDSARVQLNYTTIVSPIDGRVGIRLVDQGNIVHATDANGLVLVTQLKPISIVFTLPEQSLPAIQKEHAAGDIAVLAVDRDNRTILARAGKTVSLSPAAKAVVKQRHGQNAVVPKHRDKRGVDPGARDAVAVFHAPTQRRRERAKQKNDQWGNESAKESADSLHSGVHL